MTLTSSLKAIARRLGFQSSSIGGITGPFFGQGFDLWDAFWTSRNEPIDYAKELGDLRTSALFMAAHTWVSAGLSAARLTVVELDADNKETEIQNHPLINLFETPNPYYGSEELLSGIALNWLWKATSYVIIERGPMGQPVELWHEPWWSIRPIWPDNGKELISGYEVERNGYWTQIPIESVLVLRRGFDPETRMGQSQTASLLREHYTDRQAADFGALMMTNGRVPPMLISLGNEKMSVTQEQADELKASLIRKMSGKTTAEPAVIPAPSEVHMLNYDYSKTGLREVRQIPEERFCSAMGISPYSLHFGTSRSASTFSNVEQYLRYDYRAYIVPLQKYIAKRLARELLPAFDTATNHQVRWNYDDVELMQSDITAEWKRVADAYKARIIDQAEARDALGYKWTEEEHRGVYYPVLGTSVTYSPIPSEDYLAGLEEPAPKPNGKVPADYGTIPS